jgi:hypothetical protein
MANIKKEFSDKDFNCKKCRAHLGTEKLDRQILVCGRLAIFNFASIACLNCETINVWQSPNLLRGENETVLSRHPDSLRDLPKPDKRIVNQLGARGVTRMKNGKYLARIVEDGKHRHLGCYSSVDAASAAYSKAKNESDLST